MISEQNGLQEGSKACRVYTAVLHVLRAGRPALPRSAPHLPRDIRGDLLLPYNCFGGQKTISWPVSPLLYSFSWTASNVQHSENNFSSHPKSTVNYSFAISQTTLLYRGHSWKLPCTTISTFLLKRCLKGKIKFLYNFHKGLDFHPPNQ